ncbi:DNA-binding transcription factor Stb3 [Schizosaccharomyces pombe]|uniref:Protein STB3 homolog n=1 Tax=Schizosaccharomyces pombe (strain 972 / ATCC 24843) TaxID=284812 RepID=STB3_SCHPO|nr:ribosomal RNA processing element (RRPE)-binding protein [Schizosaccharomyces pombe]Q9P7B0.2 RecName: Full=Protein STB3 homolog [Schizosaccharomyces pombe 972h-]CAB86886.2 ribosomal RNA processing element (RRPE)-binding protein (predicted) [Schizosaccharomyces pombe]|eukprot:NP_001019056.3 ribosomal RNA processing element (RRPE)-binding protein [Schizosaccharomyces pombe]
MNIDNMDLEMTTASDFAEKKESVDVKRENPSFTNSIKALPIQSELSAMMSKDNTLNHVKQEPSDGFSSVKWASTSFDSTVTAHKEETPYSSSLGSHDSSSLPSSTNNRYSSVLKELCNTYLPSILSTYGSLPIRRLLHHLSLMLPSFNELTPTQQRRLLTRALESKKGIQFEKIGWGRWVLRDSTIPANSHPQSLPSNSIPKTEPLDTPSLSNSQERFSKSPSDGQNVRSRAKKIPSGMSAEESDELLSSSGRKTRSFNTPFSSFFASLEETPGSYTAHLGGVLSPREQTPALFTGQYPDNGVYYEEEEEEEDDNDLFDEHEYGYGTLPPFVFDEDQMLDGGESTDEEDWRAIGTEALLRKVNTKKRRPSRVLVHRDQVAVEAMLMLSGSV